MLYFRNGMWRPEVNSEYRFFRAPQAPRACICFLYSYVIIPDN